MFFEQFRKLVCCRSGRYDIVYEDHFFWWRGTFFFPIKRRTRIFRPTFFVESRLVGVSPSSKWFVYSSFVAHLKHYSFHVIFASKYSVFPCDRRKHNHALAVDNHVSQNRHKVSSISCLSILGVVKFSLDSGGIRKCNCDLIKVQVITLSPITVCEVLGYCGRKTLRLG